MRAKPRFAGWQCVGTTKNGGRCKRRVDADGFRCPHHPILTDGDRAARMRRFAQQEAAADLRDAEHRFVRVALHHGLAHQDTQKAFEHLVSLKQTGQS